MSLHQLLLFVSLSLSLQALSLNEAIATALNNSLDMKKVSMDIEIAQETLKEKKSSHFGRIDLAASYTHYNLPRTLTPLTPASMANGAGDIATTQDMLSAGVTYNINIFTGMSDTRSIEIADLQKEMVKSILIINQEQLIYNVRSLYMNILAIRAQIQAQKEYVTSLTKLYTDIQYKVTLESLSSIDALKSSADLNRAKSDLAKLISNQEILKDTLATTMNVDTIDSLEEISVHVEHTDTDPQIYQSQLMHSQKLSLTNQTIQKSIKQEQKTKAMYYPKISFNAFYGQNAGENDKTNPKSGDFSHEELWQAGLDLKWNIFDFGERSSLSQKSKIATMQARLEEAKTKRELQHSLKEALSQINLAISNYTNAKSELALMEETQKIEQIRYDNGASDINDLLSTKARYQLAKSSLINTKYQYKNTIYYLDYLLEQGNIK